MKSLLRFGGIVLDEAMASVTLVGNQSYSKNQETLKLLETHQRSTRITYIVGYENLI